MATVKPLPTTSEEILQESFVAIPELIRVHARSRPRQAALKQDKRVLDFAGFDEAIDRVATALQRDGARPGETIAICAATSIEYAITYFGGLRAGLAVAP